ncbi:class V lanthionine synthetase subunit LxmK [Streptomyces sp. NBC_00212]|uniref:class V lanthionine synthetase subunit LxmK n=1 Tax=Streptomyces sp. NBC_00212 TaxID=2975684 RepID=UPI002F90E084
MTIKEEAGEAAEPTRLRFAPIALEKAPEVDRMLMSSGLGTFDTETVTAYLGRNDNWAGKTTTQASVFVKRLGGKPADAATRFNRLLNFEQVRSGNQDITGPELLGHDSEHHLVAFRWLEDAQSGAELAADDRFTDGLCRRAGRTIAALHRLPTQGFDLDHSAHALPPLASLRALPFAVFANSSFAEIEFWQLLQADTPLLRALQELRQLEAAASHHPIHADLRLDQFLISGDGLLYLTDWEEFRLGDPARDVGGFIGEWLYRAVQGVSKSLAADSAFGHKAAHEDILKHGVAELERLRPKMAEFWSGYRGGSGPLDAQFAIRAAAYAGWHMLDRMMAAAVGAGRLSAADRAGAGIGRNVLLSPAGFTGLLGLDGAN